MSFKLHVQLALYWSLAIDPGFQDLHWPILTPHTIIKCIYILFHSPGYHWISSQDTINGPFFFFLSPGRHHGKSLLVITTGRLFSFCKNKRSRRDLSLHPEQVLVRKEVGHNENKEFLSFSTRAGKSAAEDEAVHVAGWSLLDWDFSSWIEAKGKEEREGERERQSKRHHCAVGGTSLKGID